MRNIFLAVAFLFLFPLSVTVSASPSPGGDKLWLAEGWALQSSAKAAESGAAISLPNYDAKNWYPISVPSTVVAGLVQNRIYKDPYFGANLRSIPGTTYRSGENFSNFPMSKDSPFAVPWWYRTQFKIPDEYKGREIWLNFEGINYRANIWLNGKQIANDQHVAGAWRTYEFDATEAALPGENNVLAVQVFAPGPKDLAITFVDWNPLPPDKDMGLWRGVYLTTSGPVAIRSPHVITSVDMPGLDKAHLNITAELHNTTAEPIDGILKGSIADLNFSQPVKLQQHESKEVEFSPDKFPQLNMSHPQLWWPAQMGAQNLYDLNLAFEVQGKTSDVQETQFGIRQVTAEKNAQGEMLFRINGKRILIRGGGWAPDIMLREDPERTEDEFRYVRDMGLNTIRLEGKLETDHFFALADRYGILVMAGWCCCDAWEKWKKWPQANYHISTESLRDQIQRLQNHPSFFVWLNGSDNPPPPKVESSYISVLKACRWPNPYISSAKHIASRLTGPSGVKMTGPYEYVAPNYWEEDTKNGGAYGFNTETSPGPAIPVKESLKKFLPKDQLWPINPGWEYHAGGEQFQNVNVFNKALNARYGPASSLDDFEVKSQLTAYENIRAMFEAYSRNKYTSTGVIQWMLNNAWPSIIWHLYDYYLQPAGGYFGAKKACEPIHAQYDYDDHSVSLVSSQYTDAKGLKVAAAVYDLDLREKFSKQVTVDAAADSVNRLFKLPEIGGLTPTYFVRLAVAESSGKLLSSNFYWLSTKPDVSKWKKSTWYYTPIESYADFTALKQLPKASLRVSSKSEKQGDEEITHITLENPSKTLAFFLRVKLAKGPGGAEVLPILYEDNYFSLMPGEKREITAQCHARNLEGAKPTVEVGGWNVEREISN